jgi:hypothetical protein
MRRSLSVCLIVATAFLFIRARASQPLRKDHDMPPPATRSGRLRHDRHAHGICSMCGTTPVARDVLTNRIPWECALCRLKRAGTRQRASDAWRDTCKARGECVRCGRPVLRNNVRTDHLYVHCDACRRDLSAKRHLTDAQLERREIRRARRDAILERLHGDH